MSMHEQQGLSGEDEKLVLHVRQRAENLYRTHQYLCTEAVVAAINEAFGEPVPLNHAVAMAAGMTAGIGESGCLCGAVSGAVLAAGMVLGRERVHGARAQIRGAAGEIHALFRKRFSSTCCRVLTKQVKADKSAHFAQCADLTGAGAEIAMRVILHHRPDAAAWTRMTTHRDSRIGGVCKHFLRLLIK